ncbi:16S rRNA (cytidine(1402)-2'-O)-methyltransferase [Marinobacterium sp. LSUCC0821]|uniref:16S rRNA (cytidine(1402)-2'-O)-methyltransferase n=1 Tax=Marinobacterium sp. LSUCC0821 TaxID=2668067 RepID=UPI0014513A37|nr:16S rRNA (cytidine(1402)-2'-O)-methyltransferase [Marinobacterium sp. LSUCC0821]QJD71254.1 16S rRNA (cytidine(1402)-2'-O)-methyltransferase [Marinobacterium sp. LSUCC0821]
MSSPRLYVVATPIGNLGDLSPRAQQILAEVDLIAAEDTRHSGKLLQHFNIKANLISVHDHNERQRASLIIDRLAAGESVALVSDAGTPIISDPGFVLVRAVKEAGFEVSPVPGCCAFVAALSASGMPSDRFSFIGFLPAKSGARVKALEALADRQETLIFYESTHRIVDSLKDMAQALGDQRRVCVARELTKTFETIHTDTLGAVIEWMLADANQQRGEFVVIVEGAAPVETLLTQDAIRVLELLAAELPPKKAAALAADITGANKKELYQHLIG